MKVYKDTYTYIQVKKYFSDINCYCSFKAYSICDMILAIIIINDINLHGFNVLLLIITLLL